MPTDTDRIEKKLLMRATPDHVWRDLTDPDFLADLLGTKPSGPLTPGHRIGVPNNATYETVIEEVQPGRLLSWRWHPGAIDEGIDYAKEPPTTVTFQLEHVPDGTMLTLVESGFDKLPSTRRARAYELNEEGWDVTLGSFSERLTFSV